MTSGTGPLVVAIDAGTTGIRAIAFDPTGAVAGSSQRELTQYFPRPGWVEHDAEEIWSLVQTVLAELWAGLDRPVAAIGITNQRETMVAWSRSTGRPLHRAIVWQDRRTADRCAALRAAGHLPLVRARTGLVLDPYFSATKLAWLWDEGGITPSADVAVGTVDSWLLWRLTDGALHATDVTNASRTLLFDIGAQAWSEELCDLFGVPSHVLPEVQTSSGRLGRTAPGVACGAGIPISGVAGDQHAALFGQACFSPGMVKATYGTGSFVLMDVGEAHPPPVDGLLTTVAWSIPGPGGVPVTHYAREGAIFSTGSAVQWLRDGLGIIGSAAEVGPLATSVPDAGGVVVVPAFTGLGSPWWDPYARGTVVGITRGTGRAQLARAVVEAMAFQVRDVFDAMTASGGGGGDGDGSGGGGGAHHEALRVDGGAAVMDLLLAIQADQLGMPVERPVSTEVTAFGAAALAGLAEGVWGSLDELAAQWRLDHRATPNPDRTEADAAYQRWRHGVTRAQGWAPA